MSEIPGPKYDEIFIQVEGENKSTFNEEYEKLREKSKFLKFLDEYQTPLKIGGGFLVADTLLNGVLLDTMQSATGAVIDPLLTPLRYVSGIVAEAMWDFANPGESDGPG